jgi:cobalamin-dependent methionine synthase I
VATRDEEAILSIAAEQIAQGAEMLDICATNPDPLQAKQDIRWLVRTIEEEISVRLCLDSSIPAVIREGLKAHKTEGGIPLVNSITKSNVSSMAKLVREYNCEMVVLVLLQNPWDLVKSKRLRRTTTVLENLLNKLIKAGIKEEQIYFDPGVLPIIDDPTGVSIISELMESARKEYGIMTICAPSNISIGFPRAERKLFHRVFIDLVEDNLDAVIANPKDLEVVVPESDAFYVRRVLEGKDLKAKEYFEYFRRKIKAGGGENGN